MKFAFQVVGFAATALAAYNDVVEDVNGEHPYASALLGRAPEDAEFKTYCSSQLIDLPGFPTRRTVLSAGHCFADNTEYKVFFGRDANNPEPDYTFEAAQVFGVFNQTGRGIVSFNSDYMIAILKNEVPESTARFTAKVNINGAYIANLRTVKTVETTGYGMRFVTETEALGKPVGTDMDSTKTFVTLEMASIAKNSLIAKMVMARGDGTLCYGDSGSAAIARSGNNHVVLGVTSSGDMQCRSLNTYSRVDTPQFVAFLDSIRPSIQ